MLCLAVPLLIGLLTGHPAEGAQASFGGLAGLYVPDSPYRYRARVVAAVGAALALAVFLGAITGSNGWVAALTAGMFAGTASFICQAVELSPPREIMFVMALLAATAIPADAADALLRAAVTAAGALEQVTGSQADDAQWLTRRLHRVVRHINQVPDSADHIP